MTAVNGFIVPSQAIPTTLIPSFPRKAHRWGKWVIGLKLGLGWIG